MRQGRGTSLSPWLYVRWCVKRGGPWTSGLHLLWWTRLRLRAQPEIGIHDFRTQTAASFDRQFELAAWSVVMLRLHFISGVAASAPSTDEVFTLADFVERAAEASETPDLQALRAWIHADGEDLLHKSFPQARYEALRAALHKDDEADAE